jgi:RNA polymerase sigma-70 factor (ECF subfamily)
MRPRRQRDVGSDLRRAARDPSAFACFYDAHADGVLAFLARRTFDVEVARDLMVETFAQAYRIPVPQLERDAYEGVVQLAALADARIVVAEAFERLQPDHREAVRLRVVDELAYADVATRLAITEATARARVSRGLRQLGAMLDAQPNMREMTI